MWGLYILVLLALLVCCHGLDVQKEMLRWDADKSGCIEMGELAIMLRHYMGDQKEGILPASADTAGLPFWPAFTSSVGMIIATEIGDKTFFIAAVLAMQHPRLLVFGGAIAALAVMTVLSALLGYALPNVLSRQYTHYASAFLFLYFGAKMIKEGMDAKGSGPSEELAEVEEELLKKKGGEEDVVVRKKAAHESGYGTNGDKEMESEKEKAPLTIFWQGFTLTFLAEWGDRSQIATIALAAAKDLLGVTVGGVLGHSLCTGMAVLGGRMLAARISEKTVHLVGGGLFLLFGLHSLVFGMD
ncbi:unnamed protein product [Chrysoparadoxa australica]